MIPSIFKDVKIMLPTLAVVLLLALCMPRQGEFEYRYHKGDVWGYETLVAPFDFPILKTEEQMRVERENAGSSFIPYYKCSERPMAEIEAAAAGMKSSENAAFAQLFVSLAAPVYEKGVIQEESASASKVATMSEDVIFLQIDKRAKKIIRSDVLETNQAKDVLRKGLETALPNINVDSMLVQTGLLALVKPNLIFDQQTTQMVHERSADNISPTCGVFKAGNVIVSQGELVTADIEQILDSYKAEFKLSIGNASPNYLLWIGDLMAAFILVSLIFSLIAFSRPTMFTTPGQYYFVLTLFVISNIITYVFSGSENEMYYLIPYPVFALYLMAFFRKRLVLPLYTICLLPLLIFCFDGATMFVTFLFSGFVGVFAFSHFNKGWRQFISSLFIFIAILFSGYAVALMTDGPSSLSYYAILHMFLGSIFAVLAYPLIYIFEVLFNLVSVGKLSDLADTSNPLLRELSDKAPGTFQHSLSVMNIAEAVGRAVDADVYLLRAAALYHDIGKLANPQAFVENGLTPDAGSDATCSLEERATEIIKHVTDGEEIAAKYNLPQIIKDFIRTHHGTTAAGYFYTRYLNEGGSPDQADAFFYPGPKPSTKEQVILMLCDSVEAASRSLKDYSPESVGRLVDDIYMSKYNLGQYDDSDITLHELELVKDTLKTYVLQIHHGRIAYPKRKINQKIL